MAKIKPLVVKIIQMRESVGWSQSELARRTKVTSAAISKIEKGRGDPSLTVIKKLAETFNVFVSELIDDSIPASTIYDEMRTFYSKFQDIDKLIESDQQLILSIVKRLNRVYDKQTKI